MCSRSCGGRIDETPKHTWAFTAHGFVNYMKQDHDRTVVDYSKPVRARHRRPERQIEKMIQRLFTKATR